MQHRQGSRFDAAKLIRVDDVGAFKEGYLGDFVLYEKDPLEDIEVVREPSLVIRDGVPQVAQGWDPVKEGSPASKRPSCDENRRSSALLETESPLFDLRDHGIDHLVHGHASGVDAESVA